MWNFSSLSIDTVISRVITITKSIKFEIWPVSDEYLWHLRGPECKDNVSYLADAQRELAQPNRLLINAELRSFTPN